MLELKMPVTVHVKTEMTIDTPFGVGTVAMSGPLDVDKDGDPEIKIKVDLPGKSLDLDQDVEIPLKKLLGPPAEAAAFALEAAGVPGVGFIAAALRALL